MKLTESRSKANCALEKCETTRDIFLSSEICRADLCKKLSHMRGSKHICYNINDKIDTIMGKDCTENNSLLVTTRNCIPSGRRKSADQEIDGLENVYSEQAYCVIPKMQKKRRR